MENRTHLLFIDKYSQFLSFRITTSYGEIEAEHFNEIENPKGSHHGWNIKKKLGRVVNGKSGLDKAKHVR